MAEFFADQIQSLFGLSPDWAWIGYTLAALIHCALLLSVVAGAAVLFTWMERKVAGRIQDRLGPTRVGGKFGWLQLPADGLKLFTKEDVAPAGADPLLFRWAPYVSFAASFGAYLALPFANGWVAQQINIAVFFILAVLGLEVFGIILAGYGSGSKWSLFGAMREAAQVVSYEAPMGLCVVVPVFLCGTMNLATIANMQAGWFTNWLVFHDPFTFGVFWVYFVCAVASVNRAPFDLAEAESELVAGFHTEYSGLRFTFFFMAEYSSMFVVAGLAAILFFGGWHGPVPGASWLGLTADNGPLAGYLGNLIGCVNFLLKAITGVTAMMWVRWTLPRLRIDQVITACWKYCVPLATVGFLGALAWRLAGLPFINDLAPADRRGSGVVREAWVLDDWRAAKDRPEAAEAGRASQVERPWLATAVPRAEHVAERRGAAQGGGQ